MTVQTNPQVTRDLRLAARQGLLPARGSVWLAGFSNMLAKELGEWFRTRRWLWQLVIWLGILDGFLAFMLFVLPVLAPLWPGLPTREQVFMGLPVEVGAVMHFFSIVLMTGTLGAIILAQDEVIQEKQSGTAAWILSKPVARPAFILTKQQSDLIGLLVFVVGVPGLIVVGGIYLKTHQLVPVLPFLVGLAVILFRLRIPGWLGQSMEFAVGLVLVALGGSIVKGYFSGRVHAHPHRHGADTHLHFHSHAVAPRQPGEARAFIALGHFALLEEHVRADGPPDRVLESFLEQKHVRSTEAIVLETGERRGAVHI